MASVDIGSETYEAFGDVDEADVFLGGDVLRAGVWALFDLDAKARGLVSATRMMLAFPWCLDPAPTALLAPALVKEVSFMLAADLLAKPKLFADASGDSNVRSAKAGSASVEFFRPIEGGPPLPKQLWEMLKHAGLVGCGNGGLLDDGPFVSGAWAGPRPLGGRYREDWPVAAGDYD